MDADGLHAWNITLQVDPKQLLLLFAATCHFVSMYKGCWLSKEGGGSTNTSWYIIASTDFLHGNLLWNWKQGVIFSFFSQPVYISLQKECDHFPESSSWLLLLLILLEQLWTLVIFLSYVVVCTTYRHYLRISLWLAWNQDRASAANKSSVSEDEQLFE